MISFLIVILPFVKLLKLWLGSEIENIKFNM